jgi:hypothetical protein
MNQIWLNAVKASQGAAVADVATYTVTTAGAHTHTINELTVATGETVLVDWGDGSDNSYSGSGTRTHDYAGAGAYEVTIRNFDYVTNLQIVHQFSTVSGDLSGWVLPSGMTQLRLHNNNSFSGDLSGWVLPSSMVDLRLNNNSFSGDLSGWVLPSSMVDLYLHNNSFSGDLSGWVLPSSMAQLYLFTNSFSGDLSSWVLPSGMRLLYLINNSFSNGPALPASSSLTQYRIEGNGLNQTTVNSILWRIYQNSDTRTATGGTINVGGSNAAPSGTFQAAASCPVTSSTPGKEVAWELLNDSCLVGFNKWTTVTFTA